MVHLRKIKIDNQVITAEYSPENSNWWGKIAVNLQTGKTSFDENENYGKSYPAHAKWKLIEMQGCGDDRTECLVMWY